MKIARILAPIALFALGMATDRALQASDPHPQPRISNLLTQALSTDFTPDREILVDLVEIPPNTQLDRHWHPGEEFHYYLEGDARITIDGGTVIEGKPGTVGHVPYKARHTASAGKLGARMVVFRVHTAGQPMRYLEDPGTSKH